MNHPCVLVVEDEMLLALMVETFLRSEGFDTLRAARLPQAMAMAADHAGEVDCAMLDINLGGDKVFPLAGQLAAAGVPFLFASAYGSQGIPEEFRDRPVVPKPYLPESLVANIRALLPDGSSHAAR